MLAPKNKSGLKTEFRNFYKRLNHDRKKVYILDIRISGEGLIQDVFSAWLGNVSYADYLQKVQEQLLGQFPSH